MAILDFFKPVSTWTVDKVGEYLDRHHPEDFTLLDVRQPKEYEEAHLPGAVLMPMAELEKRLGELKANKPTIVYCASGVRSRAAASVLGNAGFTEVYNMGGGIHAWQGLVATGTPEPDLDYFSLAETAEEHVALAWLLEEGARAFYEGISDMVQDREAASLFRELTEAEEHHKSTLEALYEGFAGCRIPADFPRGVLKTEPQKQLMEGGLPVEQALQWASKRPIKGIIELAIAVETNAFDRYLILHREVQDEHARRAFEVLSDEERRHLKKLTEVFEHFL